MDLDRLSPRELFEYLSNLARTDLSEDAPEHVVNRADPAAALTVRPSSSGGRGCGGRP
jgi:hypothetical protein